MHTRIFQRLILVVLITLLAGCAQVATPTTPPAVEEQAATQADIQEVESPPSIALVLIGPKDDNSWAEAAYNALQVQAERGARTAYSESVSDVDVARVMRGYAEEGFDIIIAHSFSYQDAVFEVAEEYPNVNFAWAGGINRTAPNVADYDQPFYEPSYLVGILAGHLSQTGSLGALYGFDIPVCHAMGEAMLAGAKTVNPDATLTVTAVGNWGDVSAAKEAALAQVDTAGVDFFLGCGEGPTLGSIEAARETGAYATGYVGDMARLAPDVVLSSIVWNMTPIFQAISDETAAGTFNGPFYRFGVKEGALDVVLNPDLAARVPTEAIEALEAARQAIVAGDLEVPFIPE
ncbi:MAG: BMP family protein [Caldilinea sp.]|nr:BMP family protein [Caldilinea sp.]MDW8439383.1 BMP family protein [Caldilineaceae bacterium]